MTDEQSQDPFDELRSLRERVAELESQSEQLRQSGEKYRQLVKEINDVIYNVDRDGVITYISPVIEPISGFSVSEIIGRPFVEFIHPDDVNFVELQFNENISGKRDLAQFRFRVLTKTGDVRWARTYSRPIFEQERVVALRGVMTDITEQVKAQDALQQRNRELELLNQAGQTFLSTLELDAVLGVVLDQMRHLLGVTACSAWLVDTETGELVCLQVTNPQGELMRGWRLAPGQGLAGWVVQHSESLNVADVLADDRHFKTIDEQTGLPLRSILTIPLKIKGHVIGVLQAVDIQTGRFSAIDETLIESLATTAAVAVENARLYEELKASQEWARNIINSSLDAIIAVDVQRHIVEFNSAAQEIFGYQPKQVLGKHVEMLYADKQEAHSVYRTTIELGRHVREITNRRKDGATFPSLLSASVLRNEQGELVGVMGVSRDITQRVLAKQELDRYRDHLEELVAERTFELAEANERLKGLDRLKSKFIADISHELRTPLANVRLYLQLLKSGNPEKRTHYFSILEGQTEQLIRFFEDILNFSMLEMGLAVRACQPAKAHTVLTIVDMSNSPLPSTASVAVTCSPASRHSSGTSWTGTLTVSPAETTRSPGPEKVALPDGTL